MLLALPQARFVLLPTLRIIICIGSEVLDPDQENEKTHWDYFGHP